MKTPDGSAEGRRALSGVRQGLVGLGLLALAYILWEARYFIPALATTRVMATAVLSTLHDGSEVQLQRAFAAAKMSSPAEATFEADKNPALHDVTYYLSVTADTPERARADLAALADALKAAFPSAERNLMVSLNNSTVPAPNDLSRLISFGVKAAVVLMMLGAQLLMVIGAYREGMGRAGVLAALATPFTILIFPTSGNRYATSMHDPVYTADWKFVLLLLALTPIPLILGLWLTRESRRVVGQRRRP
jgi:hypothetical protein